MKNLYVDLKQIEAIEAFLEESDGAFLDEKMESMYDRLEMSIEEHIESSVSYYHEIMLADVAVKAELDRIAKYRAAELKKADTLKSLIKYALEKKGVRKVVYGTIPVSITKKAPCLPKDIKEEDIPDEYFEEIPASRKLNRNLLLKAAKVGMVPQIEIVTGETIIKIG